MTAIYLRKTILRTASAILADVRMVQNQRAPSASVEMGAAEQFELAWDQDDLEECARILARCPDVMAKDAYRNSVFLFEAMDKFDVDKILRLIDLNFFEAVPTQDLPFQNVWASAINQGRLDVMKALWGQRKKHPISVEMLTTALSTAARHWACADIAAWVLEKGADLEAVASEERFQDVHPLDTALFNALDGTASAETVRILLAFGANPNRRDEGGRRLLAWAVGYGDLAKVRALLAREAYVPDETEDADFWHLLIGAPEECVEQVRRSLWSRQMGNKLMEAMSVDPPSLEEEWGHGPG